MEEIERNDENIEPVKVTASEEKKLKDFQEEIQKLKEKEDALTENKTAHFRGEFNLSELTAGDLAIWVKFQMLMSDQMTYEDFSTALWEYQSSLPDKTRKSSRVIFAEYLANKAIVKARQK